VTNSGVRIDKAQEPPCACGHAMAQHDRVALRYCNATDTAGSGRGCICSAGSSEDSAANKRGDYVRA
jgi:hypothetical protein